MTSPGKAIAITAMWAAVAFSAYAVGGYSVFIAFFAAIGTYCVSAN